MPTFDITGVDKTTGKEREISFQADNEKDAIAAASRKGVYVSQVRERPEQQHKSPPLQAAPQQKRGYAGDPAEVFNQTAETTVDGKVELYLFGIGSLLHKIHFWIRFWSVLIIIASLLAVLAGVLEIANQHS